MELKNLRTFQAVVDQGSYQKAADGLGYTQSTVTVHIQQLEEELGVPLFERVGRRMVLTQVGEQALAQARELLAAADRLAQLGRAGHEPFNTWSGLSLTIRSSSSAGIRMNLSKSSVSCILLINMMRDISSSRSKSSWLL